MALLKALLRILSWIVDRVGGALGALILGGALTLLLVDAKLMLGLSNWVLLLALPIWAIVGIGALFKPAYLALFFLPTLFVVFYDDIGDGLEYMEPGDLLLCLAYLASLVLLIVGSVLQSTTMLLCGTGLLLAYALIAPKAFGEAKEKKQRR